MPRLLSPAQSLCVQLLDRLRQHPGHQDAPGREPLTVFEIVATAETAMTQVGYRARAKTRRLDFGGAIGYFVAGVIVEGRVLGVDGEQSWMGIARTCLATEVSADQTGPWGWVDPPAYPLNTSTWERLGPNAVKALAPILAEQVAFAQAFALDHRTASSPSSRSQRAPRL